MDQRRSQDRPRYEPIRLRSLWVGMAVIVLFGVPFYLPPGTTHPMVLGVPYWMAISVVSTLLFAALTSWICLRRWNIDEPEEEAGGGA
ncbi:hypothetical protein [Saccharopolyspora endophytica]|uniref:DUF3311 domain-containing protein n=1 Tax=Saccharopolyspora endophytica TaxID=543886 RepID=A0ABS5DE45_9PSEU|nr:hypothetical protein [Saccharopolyspora endophytica]MBQ0924558.1 hypothetical protein [Saccharopolyspora endophytica]